LELRSNECLAPMSASHSHFLEFFPFSVDVDKFIRIGIEIDEQNRSLLVDERCIQEHPLIARAVESIGIGVLRASARKRINPPNKHSYAGILRLEEIWLAESFSRQTQSRTSLAVLNSVGASEFPATA